LARFKKRSHWFKNFFKRNYI